ncbi:hypothetical protein AB0B07_09620 [Streptomyces sioyaensis]|uniref:hypothetical protein n=1 Tax=Streptomyces sioyaensis TaxID=67364 RepID=UPI0034039413
MSAAVFAERPLAHIYDRAASRSRTFLDLRLLGCRNTAVRHGWEVAGTWVDLADAALDDLPAQRPEFMGLIAAMRTARESSGRPVICLVHNWDRLSRDGEHRTAFQRHVAGAGGWTATTFDETDQASHAAFTGCSRA